MQPAERQVSVWVCQEEKLVLGLSRRTSCADVVRVLLVDAQHTALPKASKRVMFRRDPEGYCIVETWKGLKRILPHNTRLLRLWDAWGSQEQSNVKFSLVNQETAGDQDEEYAVGLQGPGRSALARVVRSRDNTRISAGTTTSSAAMCFSPGKQRRIVNKAFRKLEKMNKKKARATPEPMETLVRRVVTQDQTLHRQGRRIQDLNEEIDRFEAQVHLDRVKSHGVNYVQNTYSVEGLEKPPIGEGENRIANLEAYVRQCQEMLNLQQMLEDQEALMDHLTKDTQEELNRRWMERRRRESSSHLMRTPQVYLLDHVERICTELDTSLYIGLRLDTDLEAVEEDIQRAQETLRAQEREMQHLLIQVDVLDADRETLALEMCNDNVPTGGEMMGSSGTERDWVEQTRCCDGGQEDDDSDTGISSLHSQDSDIYPGIPLTSH